MLTALSLATVARTAERPPDEMHIGVTVKVFTVPSKNDTMSWQEDTEGSNILCYRDGHVYLGWLEDWQPHATRTGQSSFAHTTETWLEGSYKRAPSYTLKRRDLPADALAQTQVPNNNNEGVVQCLDYVWNLAAQSDIRRTIQP